MAWASEESFAAFYERTARAVWAYVYRASGNSADAEDVVQEAFCRLATADVEALSAEERRRPVDCRGAWRRAGQRRGDAVAGAGPAA